MRKSYLIIAALIMGMMASVSSCKKKTVDPEPEPTTPTVQGVEKTEPTEDQFAVKFEKEALVFGEAPAGDDYAQAIKNRLVNVVGTYNSETTDVIVIFSSANNNYTEQDYHDVYDCYKKGGKVIVVNPSIENFVKNFRETFREKAFNRAVLQYNTQGITREQWMKHSGKKLFHIASQDSLMIEKNVVKCLGFHNGKKYVFKNEAWGEEGVEFSKYQCGLMADGLAEWTNNIMDAEKNSFSDFLCRGNDLSSLTDKQEKVDETYSNVLYFYDNYLGYKQYAGTVRNTLDVYASHDINNHTDYYQVDKKLFFKNGLINPVPDKNNHGSFWTWRYVIYYFSALKNFNSTLGLTIPNGNIYAVDSHPENTNENSFTWNQTTNGTSYHVGPLSVLGFSSNRIKQQFRETILKACTTRENYEITVGSASTVTDLKVIKETGADEHVLWNYTFNPAHLNGSGYSHNLEWWASTLSIADCNQQSSVLYKVVNPSGHATVHCNNEWNYGLYQTLHTGSELSESVCNNNQAVTFELPEPIRCYDRFGLVCTHYGNIQGNVELINVFNSQVDSEILGTGVTRFNNIGGTDNDDVLVTANDILEQFMNEFRVLMVGYHTYNGEFKWQLVSVADPTKFVEKTINIR